MKSLIKLLFPFVLFLNFFVSFSFDCDYITQIDTNIPKKFYLGNDLLSPGSPYIDYMKFGIPESCYVHIKIYDVNGDSLKTGLRCSIPAGNYKFNWGEYLYLPFCKSGVYFLSFTGFAIVEEGEHIYSKTEKFLIVK